MSTASKTILFHGNCVDGWFSAYFAMAKLQENADVSMFPISPSQPNTWPSIEVMKGTDVWLLDVSVAANYREDWLKNGVLSIQCIDHHASAVEHWPAASCPIHTECCAALQTYRHFFPTHEVPTWLHSVDRVDRWVDVTYEDRCLREYLQTVAHLPVQKRTEEAINITKNFVMGMYCHPEESMKNCVEYGGRILEKKDHEITDIIHQSHKTFLTITSTHAASWGLPATWEGKNVFLMDTTAVTLDSTEASYLVFQAYPQTDIFINYRTNQFYEKVNGNRVYKSRIVYSARCRPGFDMTANTILRGHPTSAGASLVYGEHKGRFPFMF